MPKSKKRKPNRKKPANSSLKNQSSITPQQAPAEPSGISTRNQIARAVQHHNKGELAQAEAIYNAVLQDYPNDPDALHFLGLLKHQMGKSKEGVQQLQKSVAARPGDKNIVMDLGNTLVALEDFDNAIISYQKALKIEPEDANTHYALGLACLGAESYDDALESFERATALDDNFAEAHNNKGNALVKLEKYDEAIISCERAIELKPSYHHAFNSLGYTYLRDRNFDKAVEYLEKAIEILPGYLEAIMNLGQAREYLEQFEEAIRCYRRALKINPKEAKAHNNIGSIYLKQKLSGLARPEFQKAIELKPDLENATYALCQIYRKEAKMADAITAVEKLIDIDPENAAPHGLASNLRLDMGEHEIAIDHLLSAIELSEADHDSLHIQIGQSYIKLADYDKAIKHFEEALKISPDSYFAYANYAGLWYAVGDTEKGREYYKKSAELNPVSSAPYPAQIFGESYQLGQTTKSLYKMHSDWNAAYGKSSSDNWLSHDNSRIPERLLRVGFVSGDFGRHPVGYFIVGLLENLSKTKIKTYCYQNRHNDDLTLEIFNATDAWRDVRSTSDEDMIEEIQEDKIDILFDLSGHTSGGRLSVFARKPAPIQVTWAGYIATTGLESIDYLLSDIYSTPLDEEVYYSEKIIRMPDGWLCYKPPEYAPKVGPLPAAKTQVITFGSFNNPNKINPEIVSVWANVLEAVPNSQLLLKYSGLDSVVQKNRVSAVFKECGIDLTRVIFEGAAPHIELMRRYEAVDIALDTYPYSGGLTTFEALWMGVPVISLPGDTFASRHSQSHLSTIGLPELVAKDKDDFVTIAANLAGDIDKLETLRKNLRPMMKASPSCDAALFAKNFEVLMRDIWRKWCLEPVDRSSAS